MISVLVCSRNERASTLHQRSVVSTIGTAHQYMAIDNSTGRYGLCAAYNEGVSRATGDVLLFVHEDVFFLEPGWGPVLERKFSQDSSIGLVGIAGTQYLCADDMRWFVAGQPFLRGRVLHELDKGKQLILSVFSWDKADADVVAVDGLFLAVRADLFPGIRFDDTTFKGFHFYDLDICMQVRRTHRCIVTWDILVKHLSAGKNDPAWHEAARDFARKHGHVLPAACAPGSPDPARKGGAMNYDVTRQLGNAAVGPGAP